jgi:hypothetical protein
VTRQERFIVLLVLVTFAGHVAYFGRDFWLAWKYGASGPPPQIKANWTEVSVLIEALANVVCAIWLYIEAKSRALKAWAWSLLGLSSGLIGVLLYFAVQIHNQRAKET